MLFENETFRIARSPFLALVLKEEASSPWWKSAPLPSRLGNVLKLLSRERKRPVFSDFHHRLLGGYGFHDGIGFVPQTAVFAFAAGFTRAKFIAADLGAGRT